MEDPANVSADLPSLSVVDSHHVPPSSVCSRFQVAIDPLNVSPCNPSQLRAESWAKRSSLEQLPDTVLVSALSMLSLNFVDRSTSQFRCASRHCMWLVGNMHMHGQIGHNSLRSEWGQSMGTTSRRILRAGRSCTCWLILNLVIFPLLVSLRVLGADIPDVIIFLPTWLAFLMSFRTTWTSISARRAIAHAVQLRSLRAVRHLRTRLPVNQPRHLLLNVDLRSVQESRAFNFLHLFASLPLPLVHVAIIAHWFVEGCLLSLVPSLLLSIFTTWSLLSQRCKFQAVCGMLSSIAIVLEWCFFPACLLPMTIRIPVYKVFLWLLPVTTPHILFMCFALEARAYHIAAAVVFVYVSTVCLHVAFVGAGPLSAAMSCVALSISGCLLARTTWYQGVLGHQQVEALFAAVASILD